ncbi:MAG: phosphoribosylanthranilate isomerase [Hydrogenophilales bacterium CG03_land_8_20_14_0_80_62_28]|nr:phosphoribosylanthranilate isomerase [Betaproteobacteria bacterium]OIO78376.1 MAG: N-(5'-phosphoribosyl)anthranilate isomerase [Hydrogenophilaceae bacterium CG1_02_62_390]PIV24189.1 MAG: phosphoribosylanthranilate isomerase [Hydrogenophilales bacterium CG03_land_8_20_14_0_80_62_28]PIW37577.1 MAG: phosphoribosylanthranilate isomerase [Hydrogenophilales bacterium CG15_BIG_FIL_POST_REV_8_21_14_020_62_31]PIW70924.1 MAG: phosphoribosylanthranilate isomerase [Hydrogenophilales bacterium CG12_big_f
MRTRIKICGITRIEDGLAAAGAGADAIGLVFAESSPRRVDIDLAVRIAHTLPPFVAVVALFVNPTSAEVNEVIRHLGPDLLQFHGEETPAFCQSFGRPFLKAARVRPDLDLLQYAADFAAARGLLLDAYTPGAHGGAGRRFDWSLIPAELSLPVILAGGLAPGNVAAAVRRVRPWAVDVSSGVEVAKGVKDAAKIFAFIKEVQNADV